ncbi:hypothetical protein LCGC14_2599340 [marine sediment metagenome]|uniref:Uncharacterized protein n=1 Tax=marine sediment metagenome TaxID=412755 RepID=A0A0F9D1X5_9ZZZZ
MFTRKKGKALVESEERQTIFAKPMSEKDKALIALQERQDNPPMKIDNASLYAESPMFFYCKMCDGEIVLPESFTCAVPKLCNECDFMKEMGWFE